MNRNPTRHGSPAMTEAVEAIRLQIDDLDQRIERQQKRVQRVQMTSGAGRRSEPSPAAEPQAVLADMVKQRDAMQAELGELEAQQSSRTD